MNYSKQSSRIENIVDTYWKPLPFASVTLFEMGVCLDASSTCCFMKNFGIAAEENPMVRYLAENMGIIPGLATHAVFNLTAGAGFYLLCKYFGGSLKKSLESITHKENNLNPAYFGYAGLLYLSVGKLSCGIENMMLYLC